MIVKKSGITDISKSTAHTMRLCFALILLYVILIFVLPVNKAVINAYNFSHFQYHAITLLTALPNLAVWVAGFYGYAQLYLYAQLLGKASEAHDFKRLAAGCAWLVWSLPVPTLVAAIVNGIANAHSGFHPTAIIVSNYVALIVPFIAFATIASASRGMVASAKVQFSIWNARFLLFLFTMAGVVYCLLTFNRFDSNQLSSSSNPYFIPIWLMVISVMVPYIYAWFMGLLAAYEINGYSRNVRGVLYRQALNLLVLGLIAVIISSIAVQYAGTIQPRVGHFDLNTRFFIVILFRIIGGSGFILLALGAKRLRRIEEV